MPHLTPKVISLTLKYQPKVLQSAFKVTLLCAFLCCALNGHAMDLLQIYQNALIQDPTLLAAKAATAAERERIPQARAQMLPSLSASFSRNRNNLESTSENFLGQESTTYNRYPSGNKTVSLRQPIYRKQLMAQYQQAQAQVADAESTLNKEEQNLALRVAEAYFEALLAHDQLALVASQKQSYTSQLDAARKSFAAGSGTRTDIDDAQARLDMNAALEIETRQHVDYTLQQVQALIDQPIDRLAPLQADRLQLDPLPYKVLDDWMSRAEQSSPEIRSLVARVEVARQELEKARSGHYPTLDAVAQWTQSDSESVTNTSNRYTNRTLGLQLNVPLYAGGYVNAGVRQALAGLERAEQALEAGRRSLGLRVHKEFRTVTESIPKIRALEQAVRSADQSVLSSEKSFQAGSRTRLDILNAQEQRLGVMRDLAQARYLYLLSRLRLLALVDEAGLEAITTANQALQP